MILTNLGTGVARTSTANADGSYQFSPLIPGTYKIVVSANGFQTETITNVVVNLGTIVTQNVTLKIGSRAKRRSSIGNAPYRFLFIRRSGSDRPAAN